MFGLGPAEVLIIIVVALVVFGPSRLPRIGRMLGETVGNYRSFKKSTSEIGSSMQKDLENIVLGPPDGQ